MPASLFGVASVTEEETPAEECDYRGNADPLHEIVAEAKASIFNDKKFDQICI